MQYGKLLRMSACTLSAAAVASTSVLAVATALTWGLIYPGVLDGLLVQVMSG